MAVGQRQEEAAATEAEAAAVEERESLAQQRSAKRAVAAPADSDGRGNVRISLSLVGDKGEQAALCEC